MGVSGEDNLNGDIDWVGMYIGLGTNKNVTEFALPCIILRIIVVMYYYVYIYTYIPHVLS